MRRISELKVKLFADGADYQSILHKYHDPLIKGFTTNPALMRKSGVTDYQAFAFNVLQVVRDKPISFEVITDEFDEMEQEARQIAAWGSNVFVKIPVTNTRGEFSGKLIRKLSTAGIPVNVTAILTVGQIKAAAGCLAKHTPAVISVLAGRIADTGVDPVPMMREAITILQYLPNVELLWASPRELLNIVQADQIGCHIITLTDDLLGKVHLLGKDLEEYSLETVRMLYKDAAAAGLELSGAI
jgi:transaldolase